MLSSQEVRILTLDFNYKNEPAFRSFLDALTALLSTLSDPQWKHSDKADDLCRAIKKADSWKIGEFAPSIGFLDLEYDSYLLKKYLSPEITALIKAYRELANVVGSFTVKPLMNAEADKIESKLDLASS